MTDIISLNLEQSYALYRLYQENYSSNEIPDLVVWDSKSSASEYFDELAFFALNEKTTLGIYYSFKSIFLEICSRWICKPEIETRYHKKVNLFQTEGVTILSTLSRLLNISQEHLGILEYYLLRRDFWAGLKTLKSNECEISSDELNSLLLAFYRLLSYDLDRFYKFVEPEVLYEISKIEKEEYHTSKYLSIMILSYYIKATESSQTKILDASFNIDAKLCGTFEGQTDINFKHLNFLEARRLSKFSGLPARLDEFEKELIMKVFPQDLSPIVTSVCGVLVPNLITSGSHIKSGISNFVASPSSIRVMKHLALCVQKNWPVMLFGESGSGKTYFVNKLAEYMSYQNSLVKIHLNEQTDAKLLLGTYSTSGKSGTFSWKPGILTSAVMQGKWVFIEDIDKAPTEVLSVLLGLLEKRQLTIPSRGETIEARNGFQLISTLTISGEASKERLPDIIGLRLWELIHVSTPSDENLKDILGARFPLLVRLIDPLIKCLRMVNKVYSSSRFLTLNRGSHPRTISFKDLVKLCRRLSRMMELEGVQSSNEMMDSSLYDYMFAETMDCFGSSISEEPALKTLIDVIAQVLQVSSSSVHSVVEKNIPRMLELEDRVRIGRATLFKNKYMKSKSKIGQEKSFAKTIHALKLMEQIGVAIQMTEPVLLVGETGTGKTTVVQHLAKSLGKKMTAINLSQQTEAGDLLGSFKPINTKTMAVPLQEIFENLFSATFSSKKNERFSQVLSKCFNKSQWRNVIKLWREAIKMALDVLKRDEGITNTDNGSKRRRTMILSETKKPIDAWIEFEQNVNKFELESKSVENSFVFNFVEGSLVRAIKNGEWVLLDEINLASPDTLESIADLLTEAVEERTLLLTERGDTDPIKAHPEFRLFACMNPSTDIGKRDLPSGIRSRFTEIYVHSPEKNIQDLLSIINQYIGRYSMGDDLVSNDVAKLYLEVRNLANHNAIVDGASQKPHFSIRTLSRTLSYVDDVVSIYGLRRSLYEGFCMSFLTLLDGKSEEILHPLIFKYTVGKLGNFNSVLKQCPPPPSYSGYDFVQFKHYWIKRGPQPVIYEPNYIITPFVEKNMLNLARATSGRRFPVLIQGPTSAGKTSMIRYLANATGHRFIRINNHEHTDLQEYLGTFVSDSSGKLVFREGLLVQALREGHWIVLDELNLAPSDILEALNRLLDDNRELFIPETQEIVRPHNDFMLFATQNPPGLYGGRKHLSRAFRNRFLELHFDEIPHEELERILTDRCSIAPSYSKKIVEVYNALSIQRQSTRLFEQKNSFATLRDLFRWASREAIGYEELAANGYMILGERVRKLDEKEMVKTTIEKVMRVKLDMEAYYGKLENEAFTSFESPIIWTKAMRRLGVLVYNCLRYNEPVLLVGETGCGKTTICQVLATYLKKELTIVNCHENTETGDILGSQRPVRNRLEIQGELVRMLMSIFEALQINISLDKSRLSELLKIYDATESFDGIDPNIIGEVNERRSVVSSLFSWYDGPLVSSMKSGNFFLLDEISLADDSVLERLNSVLEPERTLLLAEKGVDDVNVCARDGFQFLATMNPGGDYGKKELSPALRNRFTEIWVPSMDDMEDIRQLISNKLNSSYWYLVDVILFFSEWYGKKFGGGQIDNGVISLRDILSWVEFINTLVDNIGPSKAVTHGALMVFIDAIGTNNTSYLSDDRESLKQIKLECLQKLSSLMNEDVLFIYDERYEVSLDDNVLKCGPFSIPRKFTPDNYNSINLSAPTTAKNTMRALRAMQVGKPILLEGSPGVGKTSLVSSLASSTGNKLVRINLSEQTDLLDLFGSESPSEDGKAGEFTWRDGPFLRAMKEGEWVLLDEMNLASQSVLEGLNATLDHRGMVYIPELDKSFPRNKGFTVFAAQNPQYQGGARKGLPKSFVNRFTVVYNDTLEAEDMNVICHTLFPNIEKDITSKLISYVDRLNEEVCIKKMWGYAGSPWEFNLRDILRWLDFLSSDCISNVRRPEEFLNMIVCQRFRTEADRSRARMLFESTFGSNWKRENYYNIGEQYVQVGNAFMRRGKTQQNRRASLLPLQCNFEIIESVLHGINHNIPLIITGPSNSGKSCMIKFVASIVGSDIEEFAMNSDVDSMDILGGYEQVDYVRDIRNLLTDTSRILLDVLVNVFYNESFEESRFLKALVLLNYVTNEEIDISKFEDFCHILEESLSSIADARLLHCQQISAIILKNIRESSVLNFRWFDGILVKAVEQGKWLILDNANLCSSSVVDRLNSLLEPNGSLVINECTSKDGVPKVLKPHPDFRLFITLNPKYGELSRAMRNRGVEIFMDTLENRMTKFDRKMLGLYEYNKDGKYSIKKKPMLSFLSVDHSSFRQIVIIEDALESIVRSDAKACVHAFAGVLNMWNVWELGNWISTDFFLNEKLSPVISYVKDRISSLEDDKVFTQIQNIYSPISQRAQVLTKANVDYCQRQSINPLVNQDIIPLKNSVRYFPSEWHYFYAVFFALFDMQRTLRDMHNKAVNGRANELNYIERSMATYNGRSLEKAVKPSVYFFVTGIYQFINDTMQHALDNSIIGHELLYEELFELSIIWSCMIFTSMEIDESRLRIFKDLVQAWLNRYGRTYTVFCQDLANSINSFAESVNLETGNAMEMIWMHFRNTYPSSEAEWVMVKELINISGNFDKMLSKQFPDVQDLLIQLRKYILHLYEDVVHGAISKDEWYLVSGSLKSKLSELDQLSDSLLCKRRNLFQYEFHLISNFVTNSIYEGSDTDELKLANLANKKTILRLQTSNEDIFNPYPKILDYLWAYSEDNRYVTGLLSSDLISSSIYKCFSFISCPGRELEQNVEDLKYLGTSLMLSSGAVLTDQKVKYCEILIKWIIKLLDTLKMSGQDYTVFTQIKNNPGPVTFEVIQKLETIICNLQDEVVSSKIKQLLLSSVRSLQGAKGFRDLGRSWIFFSTAALQLYVPSSPYDPAIREHINYTLYEERSDYSEQLQETWKSLREVFSGEQETLLEKALPRVESIHAPKRPRVYRPRTSVDGLFEEWKYFLDSTVAYASLMRLVNSIEKGSPTAFQQVAMLRNSANQFFAGMSTRHMYYCDINDILFGFVSGIMFGLELMLVQVKNDSVNFNLGALDLVKVSKIMEPLEICGMMESMRSFCKDMPLSSALPEQLILFIVSLCFTQKNLKHDDKITEALNGSLEILYLRWKARCVEEENNYIKTSSLYKHADQDQNLKDDFEKLFPDYDNILNIEGNDGANNNSFESLYIRLADSYIDAYLNGKTDNVTQLVLKGSNVSSLLYSYTSELRSGMMDSESMATLVNVISSSLEAVEANGKEIDFYRGHSIGDSKRAMCLVLSLCLRVKKILQQWPENTLLVNIFIASDEFLGYPVKVSIGKMLQKVEQIHLLVAEWEKYAHTEVSLKHSYDGLTSLIISWRKLELNTWNSLLRNEEIDSTKDIGKWWFHLFETIVIPVLTKEETQNDIDLIHALNLFLSQSNLGGYEKKLKLLKAFRNNIESLDSSCSVFGILSNVLSFFDQFTPLIRERIINSKKDLEKEIHDVILLASWKDVNIEALRQSSRRSHNNLYKVVRKYRSLLATSVLPIIQSGLPSDGKFNYNYKELTIPEKINIDFDLLKPYCESVESWGNRTNLLRTLDVPNVTMDQYVRDIKSRRIPDIYQMAKSLLSESDRLRNETPKLLNKDNKKKIAALKNEKRKLLSDTLKEARRIGLRTTTRADIKKTLETVNVILVYSRPFCCPYTESLDAYFYRTLEMLPRLKTNMINAVEDAPRQDLERSFSVVENLLFSLIKNRDIVLRFSGNFVELEKGYSMLVKVSKLFFGKEKLLDRKSGYSFLLHAKNFEEFMVNFPITLDYAMHTLRNSEQFTGGVDLGIYYKIKSCFSELEKEYRDVDQTITTSGYSSYFRHLCEFYETTVYELLEWKSYHKKQSFLADIILNWLYERNHLKELQPENNATDHPTTNVENIEHNLRNLSILTMVVTQELMQMNSNFSEEDDGWFMKTEGYVKEFLRLMNHSKVLKHLWKCINSIVNIEGASEYSDVISSLVSFTLPWIWQYFALSRDIFERVRDNYERNCHSTYIFASCLSNLSSQGFCAPKPPSEETADDNLQEGTGLGEGEAENANEENIDTEEDLAETAKDSEKQDEDENEADNDDDALEAENDLQGSMEDATGSEDEHDENEMDEEVDDNDEIDTNAIDEKMWGDESQDSSKEKDSKEMPENSTQGDTEAKEEDKDEGTNNENQKDATKEDTENNKDELENDEGEEEEKEVGEQEDAIRDEENERVDENVPDSEALELPENMNLDSDEEQGSQESSDEVMEEDDLNAETSLDDEPKMDQEDSENNEKEEENNENFEAGNEELDEDHGKDQGEREEPEEPEESDLPQKSDVDKMDDEDINKKDEPLSKEQQPLDASNTVQSDAGVDEDSKEENTEAETQGSGKMNEGTGAFDKHESSGSGGENLNNEESENTEQEHNNVEDARDAIKESLKQLGDSLEDFYRNREDIRENMGDDNGDQNNKVEEPDEFEHISGENNNFDTQALGSADKEQIMSMNEDDINDQLDNPEDQNDNETNLEKENEDENKNKIDMGDSDPTKNYDNEHEMDIGDKIRDIRDEEKPKDYENMSTDEFDNEEEMDWNSYDHENMSQDLAPIEMNEARSRWRNSELSASDLASGLCEQLKLILEPTVATKLTGDYKTGKRLNLKRIIPYIASDFKKDKIWMRRTKPSKRDYQIMIAIDDSKSMNESRCSELALNSIALVSKALSQLESGGLSIVGFGESVRLLHPFEKPFSCQESGPKVFQWLDFQQTKTDIRKLCEESIKIFNRAKVNTNNDLWQLEIVLSDGVCEDHETIRKLVRKARDERVMLVFVIIDKVNSNESILDMSQASYEFDSRTGAMNLNVQKYLDTFPFEFYVVVRDINELPKMLCSILRQYFSEIASTS